MKETKTELENSLFAVDLCRSCRFREYENFSSSKTLDDGGKTGYQHRMRTSR